MTAVAVMALTACGPSRPTPKSSTSVSGSAEKAIGNAPRRVVESGAVHLESADADGNKIWTLNGRSARAGLQDENSEFFLNEVTGEIYDRGAVASTFAAAEAKAETISKRLVLNQGVSITSKDQNLTIRADKILWMEDRGLFAASGNVQIISPDFSLGKMDEVWATPDLSKVGSPRKFE